MKIRYKSFLTLMILATLIVFTGARAAESGKTPMTEEGLTQFINECIAAASNGDETRLKELCESMLVPNHKKWFKSVFGKKLGKIGADEYESNKAELAKELPNLFKEVVKKGRTEVSVLRFDGKSDLATGMQNKVMSKMKKPVPLWSVRMIEPGNEHGMHLWSFVYVDGGFRLSGKMYAIGDAK